MKMALSNKNWMCSHEYREIISTEQNVRTMRCDKCGHIKTESLPYVRKAIVEAEPEKSKPKKKQNNKKKQ